MITFDRFEGYWLALTASLRHPQFSPNLHHWLHVQRMTHLLKLLPALRSPLKTAENYWKTALHYKFGLNWTAARFISSDTGRFEIWAETDPVMLPITCDRTMETLAWKCKLRWGWLFEIGLWEPTWLSKVLMKLKRIGRCLEIIHSITLHIILHLADVLKHLTNNIGFDCTA